MALAFARVRRGGGLAAMDTGPILEKPWRLADLASVWPRLDLLLTNEHELLVITKAPDLAGAIRRLRGHYRGEVVVKRGARGVIWLPAGTLDRIVVPAPRVRVVNTVGAGDAFNGALLAALGRGLPFRRALVQAGRVAAGVVASPRGVLGARRVR
jgi:sugar/nucleoside kinase (ribokinase family)